MKTHSSRLRSFICKDVKYFVWFSFLVNIWTTLLWCITQKPLTTRWSWFRQGKASWTELGRWRCVHRWCSVTTCYEWQRMHFSGLVSPSGCRLLSQSPVTRSSRPTFTLTAELFIKAEKSTGDPANFSMGLLAVLAVRCATKRQTHNTGLK